MAGGVAAAGVAGRGARRAATSRHLSAGENAGVAWRRQHRANNLSWRLLNVGAGVKTPAGGVAADIIGGGGVRMK